MSKIIWLIGASNGIGLELAKLYLKANNKVIVSARDTSLETLQHLKQKYEGSLHLVNMDVTDNNGVMESVGQVWDLYGGLDLCFYNAGVYESMSIKQWDIKDFEAMNQVNYMGAIRVLTQIVPLFEEQKKGHIAFNISISSYFGLPNAGGYSAPKAALLNFCESVQPELELNNIKLQVVNHGFVKTRLTAKNAFDMPQLLEADEAAKKIYEGLEGSDNFEIKFPFAMTRFLHFLRIIPYYVAFYFTKKAL